MQPGHSGILRERLREASPQLYAALERSWEIALDTWLHLIGMNAGSTNSYPHLRNVERYLDHIVTEFESMPGTSFTKALTTAELYLLLAGVLFHDIGRIREGQVIPEEQQPQISGGDGKLQHMNSTMHAVWSAVFIKLNRAALGIPADELAKSLAKICLFHDPPQGVRKQMLDGTLVRTVVDPYGEIREPLVAALLTLADTMDGTHTRVVPLFLAKPEGEGIIALFRQLVRAVRVDAAAGMVRTVLTPDRAESPLDGHFAIKAGRRIDALGTQADDFAAILEPKDGGEPKNLDVTVLDNEFQCINVKDYGSFAPEFTSWKQPERKLYWLLASDIVRVVRVDPEREKGICAQKVVVHPFRLKNLPPYTPWAIVLGNLRENGDVLKEIHAPLADAGIRLLAWLLDDKEQLYTSAYQPTYEPVFSREYLHRIAHAMWEVSTPVFVPIPL